ncbi:SusD/RagB family nutrient-binding outer membrane lipoprotein [Galbibacter mesophilus]|uniref:SusD/RagB family nutrient-binding outer membrane lipoprotein n=1 Tax=Galbibacter mesophilus TaxID=379069 RepID=UPI00191EBC5E|nr:SusD/RagB family nutrient-binding outer membrane lipoprotein [Galbibacter mesophilus]MCM5662786.1 SusD/RagB family nutrient-binding outer membrane lipoprotein [Galbibacter mesophilus]
MKKINIYILLITLVLSSCSNFDDDINSNPNAPNQASGMQLIAQAQLSLPGLSSSPQGEFMAQYLAESQYVGVSLYPMQNTSFYGWYQGPLADLEAVLTSEDLSAADGPVVNQLAVAKILKAYYFWNITDRWGDVPYTEALKGQENFTPKYDTQESIYNDLFNELKEAANMMVSGDLSNDIIYGGDMQKWRKLSNSIRLLMALRLSEVDPAKAQAEFVDAMGDGVLSSNEDNLFFQHLAEANNQNYWYSQIVDRNREWWAITEGMVSQMKPYDDPRLPIYANPARSNGEYVGMLYGEEENIGTEEYSLLGDDIYAQDAPVYLLTYAQVLFAMAEASERGWIAGDSEGYYKTAIENSILQWTGTTDGVSDYLAQPDIMFNGNSAMEQIALQRWIHLYMFGYEAWAEWRRTGLPDIFVSPNGVDIPTRLGYPDNEAFNNEESYNEAIQRQFGGQNDIYGKIWWDK